MKLVRTLLGTLLLAPLAGLHAGDALKPPRQPNVIVLLTDDQGYGDLGCHGNPVIQTPHLDRLAHESVRFSDFHVDSYCTPTRDAALAALRAGLEDRDPDIKRTCAAILEQEEPRAKG